MNIAEFLNRMSAEIMGARMGALIGITTGRKNAALSRVEDTNGDFGRDRSGVRLSDAGRRESDLSQRRRYGLTARIGEAKAGKGNKGVRGIEVPKIFAADPSAVEKQYVRVPRLTKGGMKNAH